MKKIIEWLYKKYVRGEPIFHQGKLVYPCKNNRYCEKHIMYFHPELECDYCISNDYKRNSFGDEIVD